MKKRFILSLIFLIIGIIIYVLFRFNLIINNNLFTSFIRNYIPDMCWALSFFFASINFTKNITSNYLIVNSIFVLLFGIIFELLQYFRVVKGTFDVIDIIVYFISIIIAALIEFLWRRKEND